MICMLYVSSAVLGLNEREVTSIVKASQLNNQQLGVTGILLYNSGNFMQLLLLRSADIPELRTWLQRRDTWTSDTVQNEIFEMIFHL